MNSFLKRAFCDLYRCEPDSLIHHLHAHIPGLYGDLFSTIGVTIQTGFADEDLQVTTQLIAQLSDPVIYLLNLFRSGASH